MQLQILRTRPLASVAVLSPPRVRPSAGSVRRYLGYGALALMLGSALLLAGCNGDGGNNLQTATPDPNAGQQQQDDQQQLISQGEQIFRSGTFGDETFWTDTLHMNQVIEQAVDPATALSVGIKVDVDALPQDVVNGIRDGSIPLNDPQTTLALLKLGAVVGLKGQVSTAPDGSLQLDRVGVTCALCHSTVTTDVTVTAQNNPNFPDGTVLIPAGNVGHRLDGWPNRDLNPGAIIALSPAVAGTHQADVYKSWGPGKYDARFNIFLNTTDPTTGNKRTVDNTFLIANASTSPDGTATPYDPFAVLIPPAYGLKDIQKEIYTGDGDTAHEPIGPVAYWNRYVAVTQMGGHGTFTDPRLNTLAVETVMPIDTTAGGQNLVHDNLPALQAYQLSIAAPTPPDGSFDAAAAARGKTLFNSQAQCSECHSDPANPALFTDANQMLHPRLASAALDTSYVVLSGTQMWRTSPLRGVWSHPPYFHDGSGNFLAGTNACADGSGIPASLAGYSAADIANPNIPDAEKALIVEATKDLACVVNRYNAQFNLGLTDSQTADLVAYIKSL